MNSPYMGNFRVTQQYKGSAHDGLDLVGLDSKEIHSTVSGVVSYVGWENANNHSQGFGQYVKIRDDRTGYNFYFGHLSEIKVSLGQRVAITDVIGIEGSTGYSTGSHCHYCIRTGGVGTHIDVSEYSGIPNSLGIYNDGYVPPVSNPTNDSTSTSTPPSTVFGDAIKGIDVSEHQGVIDWERVANSGVKFAILRAGYGREASQVDKQFKRNYEEAGKHGIARGCYWFSYATSAEEAKKEAQVFLQTIKGMKFEYPVFLDMEDSQSRNGNYIVSMNKLGKIICSDIARTFLSLVEGQGYWVGLYTSRSYFVPFFDEDIRNRYTIWVAEYASSCKYTGSYGLWQYSSKGSVPGISGDVDMNWCYNDYEPLIKNVGLNGYEKQVSTIETPPETPAEIETPVLGSQMGFKPDLVWSGKYDEGIEDLQRVLSNEGCVIKIDGYAGNATYAQVIPRMVKDGDTGGLATWVVRRLHQRGFLENGEHTSVDAEVLDAIYKFQKHYNLEVGYVGGTDWFYLLAY